MRNRKSKIKRHQDINDFWLQNSITSNDSRNRRKRTSKMLFFKQLRNIEDSDMYEKQVQLKNGTRKMYYNNVTYTLHQLESHVSYSKNHKKPLSLYLPFINASLSIVKNHVRKKKKLFNCLNSHVILKSINGH